MVFEKVFVLLYMKSQATFLVTTTDALSISGCLPFKLEPDDIAGEFPILSMGCNMIYRQYILQMYIVILIMIY